MLGIKKYTDKMNQAAIQLTIDAYYFKVDNIAIHHKRILRKVELFEQPHVITNWINKEMLNRWETKRIIDKLRKSLKKGGVKKKLIIFEG